MLKATFSSIALVAAVGVASPVQADVLTVGDFVTFAPGPPPQAAGGGGPFIITGPGADNWWETFCLEISEHMNYSSTFYVGGIANSAISGGNGGTLGGDPDYPGETRDLLDELTKIIYHEYRIGNPQGWSGDHVQWAIWMIEGEKTLDTTHASYAIYSWADQLESYEFEYEVKVINLYSDATMKTRSQDQLMLRALPTTTTHGVPEPSSLMLLGSALTAGLVARRRKAAQQ